MSRIAAIIKRAYGEELKYVARNSHRTSDQQANGAGGKLKSFTKGARKRRAVVWAVRIATVCLVLVVIAEAVFWFNRYSAWNTTSNARRADVARELRRRANLIPNLVYAVSKYAAYEQGVFKYVSDARETLKMMKSAQASPAGSALEKALSRLVALAEQYPDLKATQSIQDLLKEVTNTENRVAEAKGEYNKAAESFNQCRTTWPGNWFGVLYGYSLLPYIGLEEDAVKVPLVDLKIPDSTQGTEVPQASAGQQAASAPAGSIVATGTAEPLRPEGPVAAETPSPSDAQ